MLFTFVWLHEWLIKKKIYISNVVNPFIHILIWNAAFTSQFVKSHRMYATKNFRRGLTFLSILSPEQFVKKREWKKHQKTQPNIVINIYSCRSKEEAYHIFLVAENPFNRSSVRQSLCMDVCACIRSRIRMLVWLLGVRWLLLALSYARPNRYQ